MDLSLTAAALEWGEPSLLAPLPLVLDSSCQSSATEAVAGGKAESKASVGESVSAPAVDCVTSHEAPVLKASKGRVDTPAADAASTSASVEVDDTGPAAERPKHEWDIVICSDLLYTPPEVHELLLATLRSLITDRTFCYLSHAHRLKVRCCCGLLPMPSSARADLLRAAEVIRSSQSAGAARELKRAMLNVVVRCGGPS